MKGTGQMGPAMERINHYFTPFQAHVVSQAESDLSRFAMDQALLILEREAKFKADSPSLPVPLRVSIRGHLAATAWAIPRAWPPWRQTRFTPRTGSITS